MFDIPEGVERIWLIGKAGVGKTHIANWLESRANAIPLHIGAAMREKYGEEFFTKQDKPMAPDSTERYAKELVTGAINRELCGVLVIDSMPRRINQVSLIPGDADLVVMIRCDESIRLDRVLKRSKEAVDLAWAAAIDFDERIGGIMAALDERNITIMTIENNVDRLRKIPSNR